MKQKKLLLLGGLHYLLPVIEAAHRQGYYVITCDYLPDNIAHHYSDEYRNISIIDKEAVLSAAKALCIDGIMSFAVDPGVVTAAYVQERMNLPAMGPYESALILQNKDLFRKFLADNGFNTPWSKSYTRIEEAMEDADTFVWPIIVKPTDSAGSKGVTRVDAPDGLKIALECAITNSRSGHIIVEEFIEKVGCSSDSDSFSVDGKLKVCTFSAQRFDENATGPYVPAAFSWPSTFSDGHEYALRTEIQRLLHLLKMQTSIYNIETRVGTNGKPYIMEVSPRGGGNRLAEMVRYATGVDMITAAVRAAVGDSVPEIVQKPYQGYWAEIILHANRVGTFDRLEIDADVQKNMVVIEKDLWVQPGNPVKTFNGANDAIGTLVVKFAQEKEMNDLLQNQTEWLRVIVR